MQTETEKQGFYYIIPAQLAEGGDHIKALLYGLISSLVGKNGCCWASNTYLAKKLGRKDRTIISTKLSELHKGGWLKITDPTSKKRRICLTVGNFQQLPSEISNGQPLEISTQSNLSISNKNEYIPATEVAEVIDVFKKSVNPTINFNHKTYRKSSEELIKQFGKEIVLRAAQFAVSIHGEQYAPIIGNPYQLKLKWPELVAFKRKQGAVRVGFAG